MKFLIFLVLTVVVMAQAKIAMSRHSLLAAMDKNTIDDDEPRVQAAMQKETLYIPMARYMNCNNSGCDAVCKALGFKYGVCVSDSTCECYS